MFRDCENHSIFFAHNLKFDYSYIYPLIWDDENIVIEEMISGREKRMLEVHLYNRERKKHIYLRDSSPLFAPGAIPLNSVLKGWNKKYVEKPPVAFYETVPESISPEFMEYFEADVLGLGEALKERFLVGNQHPKITASSQAKDIVRQHVNKGRKNKDYFNNIAYPSLALEMDTALRKYYKGGYVFLNPHYKNIIKEDVFVFDVNSMYPAIMRDKFLPFRKPIFFRGKPKGQERLYVVTIVIDWCCVRDGCAPFITNGDVNTFGSRDYKFQIADYEPIEKRTLHLTNMELELFIETYEYGKITYVDGYYFHKTNELFFSYIESFRVMKEENKGALREFSKLMLNAPSGKWGQNPVIASWKSTMVDGIQRFEPKEEDGDPRPFYLPTSIFITAYARVMLVREINGVTLDNFIYCDTDSVHTLTKEGFDIDDKALGKWKLEKKFDRAKYVRQKRYAGEKDGELSFTCAGIKDKFLASVCPDLETFTEGLKVPCMKMRMRPGGMQMQEVVVTV